MARVLISKATLADFGVPRQEVAVRQPMPTAEDIERVVREADVALTPREFVNKVPLVEPPTEEKMKDTARWGEAGRRYGSKMGIEGSLAHGVAAREFPQILDAEDPTAVPFIRDYYSRQTTLPEHIWDYHTEGPYYDEQGNILPGQVPPVDAIKIMGGEDIASMGRREGYGLKPVPMSRVNIRWERDSMPTDARVPAENVGFVGNLSESDVRSNIPGNIASSPPGGRGVVGVRGFGRPQDKAFARSSHREGREGAFTAPIPPERLVGVMPGTTMTSDELKGGQALQHLYAPEPSVHQVIQQMVSEGKMSPMDAIWASIRQRTRENTRWTEPDDEITAKFFPHHLDKLPFNHPSGQSEWMTKLSDGGRKYETFSGTPGMYALDEAKLARIEALPKRWEQGKFGLENPILTEAEKQAYIDDINRRSDEEGMVGGESYDRRLDTFQPEQLPVLYPKRAGVRFL